MNESPAQHFEQIPRKRSASEDVDKNSYRPHYKEYDRRQRHDGNTRYFKKY